jgi:hypothetical protein
MNKDDYIKFKAKYFALKNINIGGTNTIANTDPNTKSGETDEYQRIIYEMARYIKPESSNRFKHDYGMKQLANQVIELNKVSFMSELQNEMSKYYMTDKIDGKRTILFLTNKKSYAINDKLETVDTTTKDICILDTEKYNDEYYIFDVMVYNGTSLIDQPFEVRMDYFDKFKNIPWIKIKPFIQLTNDYRDQIRGFKKEKKPYDVDGIILTPSDGLYNTMRVYKYKSPDQLTIDFLIKRCPSDLLALEPYASKLHNTENNAMYLLFCGIAKKVFFKLRMNLVEYYQDIFSNIDTADLPDYFPIQFEPSDCKYAYIYESDGSTDSSTLGSSVSSDLSSESSPSDSNDLDGKVGEFLYHVDTKQWELKRIRHDRKIDVDRGNYFGNNYKIAEFIWMGLHDPLTIEEMGTASKSESETEPMMYFQQADNVLQKASRNYNSYVKSELFKRFKGTDWVMDMASGKGQDLFRYSTYDMKNVLFLEIDKIALTELISRKHIFANDHKYRNKMNILIQNVDLLKPYKENIKLIDNVYSSQDRAIDLIMCNFAFHYFVESEKSIKNVCKFINHYLKPGGKFVFTAFDGKKINDLLAKNNGHWIIKTNNQIKYAIKQKYDDNSSLSEGQRIEVLLPFSNNAYYEEYLVNIDMIAKRFKKYNIILETDESFSKYLNQYRGYMDYNDKKYIDLYHYYIFSKQK